MTENLQHDHGLEGEVRSYSLQEAADLIAVSEKTMRRYVKAGKLPHWRPAGREIRILHNDLVAFIEARKRGMPEQAIRVTITERFLNWLEGELPYGFYEREDVEAFAREFVSMLHATGGLEQGDAD